MVVWHDANSRIDSFLSRVGEDVGQPSRPPLGVRAPSGTPKDARLRVKRKDQEKRLPTSFFVYERSVEGAPGMCGGPPS
jgi:hypothetical protein